MRRIVYLTSAQNMVFDCYQAECFVVDMRSSVSHATLKNPTPGQLYTFLFRQNGVGGNNFTWPAQCQNGARIDLSPRALSVQNFVASGNVLQSTGPGAG